MLLLEDVSPIQPVRCYLVMASECIVDVCEEPEMPDSKFSRIGDDRVAVLNCLPDPRHNLVETLDDDICQEEITVQPAVLMSDDEYRIIAISALTTLLASGNLNFPISSTDLLCRVVATKVPAGLLPGSSSSKNTRFRLVDQSRFEYILETLSRTWDERTITLSRDNGELSVLDITLAQSGASFTSAEGGGGEASNSRKRKRVIDEEADSAAGGEDGDDSFEDDLEPQPNTPLKSLSKELRDVYTILQQSTARGRLLAEQVSISIIIYSIHCNILILSVSIQRREIRTNMYAYHQRRVCKISWT